LEDELINLRLTSKQMQRASKKCEKNEKEAVTKLKKAIKQGNPEGARIYAQDAIREKNQVRLGIYESTTSNQIRIDSLPTLWTSKTTYD